LNHQYVRRRIASGDRRVGLIGAVAVGLAAIAPASSFVNHRVSDVAVRSATDQTGRLSGEWCSAERRAGFIVVTGFVRNTSDGAAECVEVVADVTDRDGCVLNQASALVETADIAPRCGSAFRVILDDAKEAGSVAVRFRRLQLSPLTPPLPLPGGLLSTGSAYGAEYGSAR